MRIDSPGKMKLATAGCPRNCSEAMVKDVGAVAVEGGKWEIYIGGAFATIGGTPINSIARLNSDGTLDTAFNPGLGANAAVYAIAVQPDGKVVIGGDFTAVNGNTNMNHIARLNTDGSVDATFNPGAGANGSVRAITLQLNGEILIGGNVPVAPE